ncbi:hypothetical protein BABINDRAFT_162722 [Babjeviella inositovora NRRL Y-12698]|uniref:Uncharacterized protein n=1 Tax=Babjeviella inositovora NRRL Y-12698 TaxID=984486 RepID=A0A1E3QNF1_9ASCO|nr:uncharacterized protein BABINDRAFT_162722 [Babjeviella inositovora NRRL Y-12698]ODQ78517.1 hypothetical protein BABINDRAFT_162722 [Babjeviella inositovora NRRL Y-12698]
MWVVTAPFVTGRRSYFLGVVSVQYNPRYDRYLLDVFLSTVDLNSDSGITLE